MPKVELSMFGVVAGDWGGAENKFRVLFASWACCDRICRHTMQVSMAWMRAESGGEGRSLDVVVACVPKVQSAHGPHAAMVECVEHPHHLRSEAPVLGAVEQHRKQGSSHSLELPVLKEAGAA
jgi:hypothetical protein